MTKYKLGELIEQRHEKYDGYEKLPIRGVTRDGFIPPKQPDADLTLYNVFYKDDFVFNPARMELNSIAFNNEFDKAICSSLYEIFYVIRKEVILPDFLNMFIKRNEFARACAYYAIGSARQYFRFSNLCEFEINLPSIDIQKKYVAIYKAMQRNLAVYQAKVDDLKLVCDGFLDKLKNENKKVKIGDYIEQSDLRNEEGLLKVENVKGITTSKQFIETKANMHEVNLKNYKVVNPNQFAYVSDTSRRGDKISLALNTSNESFLVSSITTIFKIINEEKLSPQYLMMFFSRNEFDRYSRYYSWGSAREAFDWNEMCNVEIPIPDLSIQKSIVQIYNSYQKRKAIAEKMKTQINSICPVLIKGALKEGE